MADPIPPAAAPPAPAETTEQKAARLVEGNPMEFDRAMANATPTEKAALEAAKKAYDAKHGAVKPVQLSGVAGGAFAIDGSGFGDAPGTVMVNGVLVPTTRWSDHTIRGTLPGNVTPGHVTITTSAGVVVPGTFGTVAAPAPAAPAKK
jgi:sulfur carrier protein ThiS